MFCLFVCFYFLLMYKKYFLSVDKVEVRVINSTANACIIDIIKLDYSLS